MIDRLTGILGVLLGVAALLTGSLYPSRTGLVTLLALLGTGCLIRYFVARFEAFRTFSRKRSTHQRLNSILMAVFFIFIVVLLNLIIRQYYIRADLSTSKRYSLSANSQELASSLGIPVHLEFFGSEGSREYDRMRGLFESYRYLNRIITFELHDLDKVPILAKKYNVAEYNTIVLHTGNTWFSDRGSDERAVTNLLVRASRKGKTHIRFIAGHGESRIQGGERTDYDFIAERLRSVGYIVSSLNLMSVKDIPGDTAMIVLAGAKTDPSADEMEKILAFRRRGGSLLILVNSPDQLKPLLGALRLRLGEHPVYDRENAAVSKPSIPIVSTYHDTPVTTGFGLHTMFPGVYPIEYKPEYMGSYRFEPIASTGETSWLDEDENGIKDPREKTGAFVIAGTLTDSENPFRAVIVGDSDFVSNAYAGAIGNTELFMRMVNWLAEGDMHTAETSGGMLIPMFVTGAQARIVRTFASFGIPLGIAVVGTMLWLRRRRL